MIRVQRNVKPKVLIRKEKLWKSAILNAKTKEEKNKAVCRYKNLEIKKVLSKMFNGKCAFCESYIEHIDYGDIEHFKPKSKFPESAVEWENLLLSCKKCNDKGQKGDSWPEEIEGGLLINPCDEDPSDFFEFIFDVKTNATIIKPKNRRGQTSEKVYGLNKPTLLIQRNRYVKKIVALALHYHEDINAKQILEEAILDSAEYAAFARMVKAKYT